MSTVPSDPELTLQRTRVLASWNFERWGPSLALGGLLAYAKVVDDGALAERYDIRPLVSHDDLLAELADDPTPAVVLFSSYIWSAVENLEVAAEVKALSGDHLVIHGGPHVPKYRGDIEEHFRRYDQIDIAAHGEGEITLVELLRVLDPALRPTDALSQVAGITFRDGGRITSTAERSRHESLEDFPSPYLTGEFDHVDSSGWQWPSIETNRGCPYSCSFCDWGSATRSRVRDFPMERVLGELQWLSDHGLPHWMINDANFGIHRRDVEIAKFIVELRRAGGVPEALYMSYAKNTVKYLAEIIKMITEAGIIGEAALALQTRDPETLRAIKRSNIRVEKFDDLAEEFRRYGLPLVTDLIIGLPGQTVESFLTDMQYCVDNDVTPRFFVALNLPNAEFNNPEYQRKFSIVLGDGDVVVETSSFTRSDRDRMMRLRMAYRSFEHFALLRHVFRYLQWDHGIAEATVIERIEAVTAASPERYPLLSWVQGYFDMFLIPPFGWPPFFAEVATFVSEEFGIEDDAVLRTVFEVQMAILPEPNRTFPSTVHLDHDYVTWFEAHGRQRPDGPRLGELPPGELVVTGDPCQCCVTGVGRQCDVRPHELIIAPFWAALHWELDSPVQRIVPAVAVSNSASQQQDPAAGPGGPAADPEGVGATASVDATV